MSLLNRPKVLLPQSLSAVTRYKCVCFKSCLLINCHLPQLTPRKGVLKICEGCDVARIRNMGHDNRHIKSTVA